MMEAALQARESRQIPLPPFPEGGPWARTGAHCPLCLSGQEGPCVIHFLPSSPIIHTSGLASNAGSWSGGPAGWAKRGEASQGAAPQITKVRLHSSNWGEAGPEGAGGRAAILPASLPACSRPSLLAVGTPPQTDSVPPLGQPQRWWGSPWPPCSRGPEPGSWGFDTEFQGHAWSLALVWGGAMDGGVLASCEQTTTG